MADVYQKFWGREVVNLGTPQFCHGLNISYCDVSEDSENVNFL